MENLNIKRKELAIKEAHRQGFCSSQCPENELDDDLGWGFLSGVVWADENTQGMTKMRKDYEFLFMLKKRELIKKSCEWMKAHIKLETKSYADLWDPSDIDLLVADFTTVDEMEESFRKAMEE